MDWKSAFIREQRYTERERKVIYTLFFMFSSRPAQARSDTFLFLFSTLFHSLQDNTLQILPVELSNLIPDHQYLPNQSFTISG